MILLGEWIKSGNTPLDPGFPTYIECWHGVQFWLMVTYFFLLNGCYLSPYPDWHVLVCETQLSQWDTELLHENKAFSQPGQDGAKTLKLYTTTQKKQYQRVCLPPFNVIISLLC